MCRGLRRSRHLLPVRDACVEHMHFVAAKMLGREDLDVPEPGANGALTQAPEHEGEEPAHEQKAGYSTAHHQQRHQCAPAITEYVTKRKKQELAHG
jgi:hypothetical protein